MFKSFTVTCLLALKAYADSEPSEHDFDNQNDQWEILREDVLTYQALVKALEDQNAIQDSHVESTEGEVTALTAQIMPLAGEVSTNAEKISEVMAINTNQSAQIKLLKEQIAELETIYGTMHARYMALHTKVDMYDPDTIDADITTREEAADTLDHLLDEIEGNLSTILTTTIPGLQEEDEKIAGQLNAYEAKTRAEAFSNQQ